ncbi:DUF421 domain-containing protein [Bacillus sp. 1P06AnD]|uniref:DUF421 domain-containing protein n=1 Tax=Bacillus sp. 1P06AnD TaxID=3132208 RepID=UPI0039A295AE
MEMIGYISFRTIIMYFIILFIFRMMGKREIGELGILDLIIFMMIAELAAVAIEDTKISLLEVIWPMVILLVIQMTLAYISLKSRKVRQWLDGKPRIIIYNGKIDEKAMKKERYNFDDLLQQLREKDIFSVEEVAFAILESTGELSVMKKENADNSKEQQLPLPLVLDGSIQEENLQKLDISYDWLIKQLAKRGYADVSNISFCSFQNGRFSIDEIDK